ncbi:MAG: hypothetical protein U5L04_05145 [Trueperaceae bacterium]|nr:hypothetical protein [Trueperaceae bacterium]
MNFSHTHTLLLLVVVSLVLVACGTDNTPPEGGPDRSSTTQIAGTLPPDVDPEVVPGDDFVVATVGDLSGLLDDGDPSAEPGFARFSSALAADGSFSIDLADPDPSVLVTEEDFCGTGETLVFGATGALFISASADLASADDIRDVLRLGSAPGDDTNYNIIWFYSDRNVDYEGDCGTAGVTRVELQLTQGWNTLALSVANPLSGQPGVLVANASVPDSARWYAVIGD